MLHFFRRFFRSKLGLGITLGFVALIAFAFASMDITSNNPTFGGVAGDSNVAVVGDTSISAAEFQTAMQNELDQRKQTEPTLTMQALIARGAADEVIEQLMQRAALSEWAREHGLRAGKRLVDSELVKIPAFFGADGQFSRDSFEAVLRREGLTEAAIRADIASGLLAQQALLPANYGTVVPQKLARQYTALLRERRKGAIATLPSAAFAPTAAPTQAQLTAFHRANGERYIRPERRVLQYATFGEEALGEIPAPTEAQIAERYRQNRAQYAASESRTFTQMIVPTEAAAQAIVVEVAGGASLAAAARSKGLSTTQVGPVTKSQLAGQSSQAVADAAFAAGQGAVATPRRGSLGWYVLKVDGIERRAERSLAEARGEIAAALAQEQRRAAFIDMATRIEDEFDNGSSLADVASELKIELQATRPLTADGRVYGTAETGPAELAPVLKTAFEMDEGEPQIAEVEPGQTFLIFGVRDITPSAVAPLTEIREDVTADWRRSEGAKAARAAADRVMKRVQQGQTLAAAIAAERVSLPAPDPIDMGREELAQLGRTPPALALFFSMAEGTVKKLEGPADAGWFVARLDDIEVPEIAADDPLIGRTRGQLAQLYGDEYAEQLVRAAMAEVGVEKNQAAIDAVLRQLTGQAK
jgi:peptidyl-prolyl cis-trans isomerase D